MELLNSYQSDKQLFSMEKYNEAREVVRRTISAYKYPGISAAELERIKSALLTLDEIKTKVKYRLDKADVYEAAKNTAENVRSGLSPIGKQAWEKLSDILFYIHRNEIDYALRWPINYMDVFPFSYENSRDIIKSLCTRDVLCRKHNINLITPPYICQKSSQILPFTQINQQLVETKLVDFVQKCATGVLSRLGGPRGNRITFVFTGDRVIRKKRQSIHVFDLMYDYLDWARNDAVPDAPGVVSQIKYLNYKIAKWITYDILHHVICAAQVDLTIYLADDYLSSLSFFFTRLGRNICTREVHFEFPMPTDEEYDPRLMKIGQPGGQNIPVHDIISAQAYYFKYHHEIYRTNVATPGFEPPQLMINACAVDQQLALFQQMDAIRAAVFANIYRSDDIYYPPVPMPTTPGDNYTFVFAAPGTGKSTYMNAHCVNSFNSNLDSLLNSILISGKTIDMHILDNLAHGDYESLPYERLKVVLRRTHQIDLHDGYLGQYIGAVREWRDRLRADAMQYNICEEEIAGTLYTYRPLFSNSFTPCGSIDKIGVRSNWIDELIQQGRQIKIVLIRIEPEKQYAQMLDRSLKEHRIIRYYTLMQFNDAIISGFPKRWNAHMEVYRGIDARELERVTNAPQMIAFLQKIDPPFAKFITDQFS